MSTKYSCCFVNFLALSRPFFRIIFSNDVFPFVVVQDKLPVFEGLFQQLLTILHVRSSAQTRGVVCEQEEIDGLRRLLHRSCPPDFFSRRISTDERKIVIKTSRNADIQNAARV